VSDAMCTGVDAAPLDERYQLFQERYDVISKNASKKVKKTRCSVNTILSSVGCVMCCNVVLQLVKNKTISYFFIESNALNLHYSTFSP